RGEPAVDRRQELRVSAVEAEQTLVQEALLELHHEGGEGLGREAGFVEPVLVDRLGERVAKQRAPLVVHRAQALAKLRSIPGERLHLRPYLGITRLEVLVDEAHRRAPLLGEGGIGAVQGPLALEDALRESLERLEQELVDRAEVVVDEAVVLAGLPGELPGRDPGRALPDQES